MKLLECVNINSGINQTKHPEGEAYLLQSSDFDNSGTLLANVKPSILHRDRLQKHYLNKGDVLVMARGHNGFKAFVFDGGKTPAVASAVFLVLRIKHADVHPAYLAWYINLGSTQELLISTSRGSALPAINKSILGELEITIPPLSVQQNIVALYKLKKEESNILKKLDELKTKALEVKLKGLINII
ncbi:Type I restriction modification DNA specificity domain-containing protein [Sinomicrobium oceani]|uniref:Type I restriction modification DNA specificity domain-containing protein n=1 Tax=Sinomicrobium oceani TaxID=1150368 RepID=A0A1K1RXM7_9FLAO|nr:restriction endonuclease subunit S [Sinomicrobium oceani]SFW76543.1 Type I restriction modification DNA specificity domain-containing protein [Sinomicrobium oceani]